MLISTRSSRFFTGSPRSVPARLAHPSPAIGDQRRGADRTSPLEPHFNAFFASPSLFFSSSTRGKVSPTDFRAACRNRCKNQPSWPPPCTQKVSSWHFWHMPEMANSLLLRSSRNSSAADPHITHTLFLMQMSQLLPYSDMLILSNCASTPGSLELGFAIHSTSTIAPR